MQLDHITIRTTDLVASRRFFETFFGLVERARPQAIRHIPGYWLYAGNEPIVHLIGSIGTGVDRAANAIDHIALRIDDYDDFRDRLDASDIAYATMELPELDERRLFLRAPGGPLIEAVYRQAQFTQPPTDDTTATSFAENTAIGSQITRHSEGESACPPFIVPQDRRHAGASSDAITSTAGATS